MVGSKPATGSFPCPWRGRNLQQGISWGGSRVEGAPSCSWGLQWLQEKSWSSFSLISISCPRMNFFELKDEIPILIWLFHDSTLHFLHSLKLTIFQASRPDCRGIVTDPRTQIFLSLAPGEVQARPLFSLLERLEQSCVFGGSCCRACSCLHYRSSGMKGTSSLHFLFFLCLPLFRPRNREPRTWGILQSSIPVRQVCSRRRRKQRLIANSWARLLPLQKSEDQGFPFRMQKCFHS